MLEPEFRTLNADAGSLMVTVLSRFAEMARRSSGAPAVWVSVLPGRAASTKVVEPAVAGNCRTMHDDGKGLRRSLWPRCVEDERAPHIKEVSGAPTPPGMDLIFLLHCQTWI
jgi:hypothetical protein